MNGKKEMLLPVLSGILTAVSFNNQYLSPIIFVSLIPLFISVLTANSRSSIIKSVFIFYTAYSVLLFLWLRELKPIVPLEEPFSSAAIIAAIAFIAALSSLRIIVCMVFYYEVKNGRYFDVVSFSFLFILGEWIQEIASFLPYPWARLGVIAAPVTVFVQSASLLGSLFISLLILIVNGSIAYIILNRKSKEKTFFAGITAAVLVSANVIFGLISLTRNSESKALDVCLVQGNFSGLSKWNEPTEVMLDRYIEITENSITADTDVVFWPESAIPIFLNMSEEQSNIISSFTEKNNLTLITGSFYQADTNDDTDYYNSIYISDVNGNIKYVYSKRYLVPLGETVPLYNQISKISFINKMIENQNFYSQGKESNCIETDSICFAGVICYESIFPCISRTAVKNGGEYIAVISNDSWFNDSEALYQHHSHAVMRAIENRRYVVSCSNTAITSVIDDRGMVIKLAEKHVPTAITAKIKAETEKSFYTETGDIIVIPGICIWLWGLALHIRAVLQKIIKKAGKENVAVI